MKNPSAPYSISMLNTLEAPVSSSSLLKFMNGDEGKLDVGWDQNPVPTPSDLEATLMHLKFDPTAIANITSMVGLVSKIATVAGWAVVGIETTKKVLEFLGVLNPEPDATKKALEEIKARIEQLYGYLEDEAEEAEYKEAVHWRSELSTMRNALANLALSRSQSNLDTMVSNSQDLMTTIGDMLSPGWGDIPFRRSVYGYTPGTNHWLDVAFPFYMTRSNGAPMPSYGSPGEEMKTRIFDPGYYLDVLIRAIGLRIATLAAMEPAFRSTGYDRDNLRDIYKNLGDFIDKWNASFLLTAIEGPLDPTFGKLSNPLVYQPSGIPMGVVDPVSGVASFESHFNIGFALLFHPWTGPQEQNWGGYWTVVNIPQAIDSARTRRSALRTAIYEACGIRKLYELRHSIGQLIMGSDGLVQLTDPVFSGTAYRYAAGSESLTLGILGSYAGKPGKTYPAQRVFMESTKSFRIPMARRQDVSQIQPGYRLVISVGDEDAQVDQKLCEYSTRSTPNQNDQPLPIFPKDPIARELRTDKATVYTVVQNGLFSASEEDSWEKHGAVVVEKPKGTTSKKGGLLMGVEALDFLQPGKQRLYLDGHTGLAALRIEIEFELDLSNPEHSFVGYAKVSVTNLEPETYKDGLILHVLVYETVVSPVTNSPQEQLADSMTLHIVPSFLLVDQEYFSDRETGLKTLGGIVDKLDRKYSISADPGLADPMWKVRQAAEVATASVATYERFAEREPEAAQRTLARHAPPAVRVHSGRP